ncbi:hypothetical protein SAMN05216436_10917 [bacterium A37T11]|nr:hypothetical protein SAMN05216436_10917 [bacterium A37T11]
MNNQLFKVWLLSVILLCALFSLYYVPELKVAGYTLKEMDILHDVKSRKELIVTNLQNKQTKDKKSKNPSKKFSGKPVVSNEGLSIPTEPVPIEDFGQETPAMQAFYDALRNLPESEKSVHMGFMGDSFIEGDILTDKLRDTLQGIFGGSGVGYVAFANPSTDYRLNILQRTTGFKSTSAVDSGVRKKRFDISGHLAIPVTDSNAITYYGAGKIPKCRYFKNITLFYSTPHPSRISFNYQGGKRQTYTLESGRRLHALALQADSARNLSFYSQKDSLLQLFGLNFENGKGLYLDNFSLRGNAGTALFRTTADMYQQTDSLLHYKLIVLQYGLNAMSPKISNYDPYKRMLIKVIQLIKAGFPHSSILVLGVGDRSQRDMGEYVTMETLPKMLEAQRAAAEAEKVAFWNMFEAMGGENSMAQFVNHDPPLANKDYTHINRRGGILIGRQLAKALLLGFNGKD